MGNNLSNLISAMKCIWFAQLIKKEGATYLLKEEVKKKSCCALVIDWILESWVSGIDIEKSSNTTT